MFLHFVTSPQPPVALPTSLSLSNPQQTAQITVSYPTPRSSHQQQTQPQKQRVFTGVVNKLHDTFGFVDEDVFFQLRWKREDCGLSQTVVFPVKLFFFFYTLYITIHYTLITCGLCSCMVQPFHRLYHSDTNSVSHSTSIMLGLDVIEYWNKTR